MIIPDERWFDKDYLKSLTAEQAAAIIADAVYQASHLLERLEGVGKIYGNGHHLMQRVATEARCQIYANWKV